MATDNLLDTGEKKAPEKKSNINRDGVEKGKILSEDEYWELINKRKAKK